jgi:hypothetical protein
VHVIATWTDFVRSENRSGTAGNREVTCTQPITTYVRMLLQRNNSRQFPIQAHSLGKEGCLSCWRWNSRIVRCHDGRRDDPCFGGKDRKVKEPVSGRRK